MERRRKVLSGWWLSGQGRVGRSNVGHEQENEHNGGVLSMRVSSKRDGVAGTSGGERSPRRCSADFISTCGMNRRWHARAGQPPRVL